MTEPDCRLSILPDLNGGSYKSLRTSNLEFEPDGPGMDGSQLSSSCVDLTDIADVRTEMSVVVWNGLPARFPMKWPEESVPKSVFEVTRWPTYRDVVWN